MNLTEIARKTLEAKFDNNEFIIDKETKKKYGDKLACFVTLTKSGDLRGCIGSLNANKELYKDVQDNVINAAFKDLRFPQLIKDELDKIKIEISILSVPSKLDFSDTEDLLKKLNKNMGIILKKGFYSATFLPQVWEELPNKIKFLENLSLKAGLDCDAYKDSEIWSYSVKIEKE